MADLDRDKLANAEPRLLEAQNIWLATVRADGRPHLIPIWFVWHEGKIWISMGRGTQKHRNLQKNDQVALSLEDGLHPVIFEGTAVESDDPTNRDTMAPRFKKKYDWDFRTDDEADWLLIAVTPHKILSW